MSSIQIDVALSPARSIQIDVALSPARVINVNYGNRVRAISVNYGNRGLPGPPGPSAVSADAGNAAIISPHDALIFVPPGGVPGPHAATHHTGGGDQIPVATTSSTGLAPILPGVATEYLDGTGIWSIPAVGGTGDMTKAIYDTNNNGKVDTCDSLPWTSVTGKPAAFPPDATAELIAHKGQPSGYAGLDATGKVPVAQLPPSGVGDMTKAVYDTNNDGVVDNAAAVLGHVPPASGNAAAVQVVLGSDTRLSDSRAPLAHASTHLDNGTDVIPLATTLRTGLLTKLTGSSGVFLDGTGTFSSPPVGGGGGDMLKSTYDTNNNGVVDTCDSLAWAKLTGVPAAFVPSAHAATHKSGGSDPIALDTLAVPTDVTTLNASTTAHGLLAKLPGTTTTYLRGDGTFVVPPAVAPAAHAATHNLGGSDAIAPDWTQVANKPASFTPATHGSTHIGGGSDAIPVATTTVAGLAPAKPNAGVNATTTQVVMGDDTRLTDARTPSSTLAHQGTHTPQGTNTDPLPLATTALAGLCPPVPAAGINAGASAPRQVVMGDDTRLTNSRSPTAHGATHLTGAADPIPVAGPATSGIVPGKPNAGVNSTGSTQVVMGDDTRLSDTRTPAVHQASHVSGIDQIPLPTPTVKGLCPPLDGNAAHFLSGAGTCIVPPAALPSAHAATHNLGGSDPVAPDWTQVANKPASFAPSGHQASHVTGTDIIPGATAAAPGLVPARTGAAGTYLDVTGGWSTPPGTGGGANARPVILGETAVDPVFTSGIIVPRYANHPDSIWTYGQFDDHFDLPATGAPNAKWVQTVTSGMLNQVYTQAASKLSIGGASPSANATNYTNQVAQNLPATTTHQISLKVKATFFSTAQTALSAAWFVVTLAYGTNTGGVSIQPSGQQVNSNSQGNLYIGSGASYATSSFNVIITDVPEYYRITYDSSKNTTIEVSTDNVTWFTLAVITAAQSGFASNNPSQLIIGAAATQTSRTFIQVDWVKHV